MTDLISADSRSKKFSNSRRTLNGPVPSLLQLTAERARRSLLEFVVQAWPILEPSTPFVDGMHVRAICEHLQALTEGRLQNLIINVPPGHAKSLLTAVFWPAWVWIDQPGIRWLFASYSAQLSVRDSVKCRRLVESQWYQARWGERYQLTSDQNQKHRFENDRTGYRIATSVGGSATGERGDMVVVDDPHSVDQAESDAERSAAVEWWNGTMSTRLNDFRTGHKVVIQQRLHEADLTGDLLAKGGFELLSLPAEYEPDGCYTTSIGWTDPRQERGELLWPQKIRRENLDQLKVTLGSYRYAGQYQQRPSPAQGGIFKRFWLRYWRPAHLDLPPVQVRTSDGQILSIEAVPVPARFDTIIQSWDMAFKDLASSDYVVGQVWGALQADRFLLDQQRGRMDMPATKKAVQEMSQRWPKAATKLVEDKANGPAVVQELRHDIAGLIEVTPEGGKVARAHAVSPQAESGNIYLPHPAIAPWINAFIDELTVFPNGRNDDQVDAMTQALIRLRASTGSYAVAESQITVNPFEIPEAWPRAVGMAVTRNSVAALWGARDPAGTIYLYTEHSCPNGEPSQNAKAIKTPGDWIPAVINFSSSKGSKGEKDQIVRLYRELGLNVQTPVEGDEAGIYHFWQLLSSNKLKVFASLGGFLAEYRIGDEQSPLLLCCQSLLLSGRDRMRTKPVKFLALQPRVCSGDRGWMT
jgi:predicted phage terminase large subunit-like protein